MNNLKEKLQNALKLHSAFKEVAVIGMGAWGKAITKIVSQNAEKVFCYTRDNNFSKEEYLKNFFNDDTHEKKFKKIIIVNSFLEISQVNLICIVVPAQSFRSVVREMHSQIDLVGKTLLICSKGIENNTLSLMSEIVQEECVECNVAILSGPNFANEILKDKPAATVIACDRIDLAAKIINLFAIENFRPYYSSDLIGVQICGAVKNVIAIAAGILLELDCGYNSHAALITRSIAEIGSLIESRGGKANTLMGLAGVGDLILTCGSLESRNKRFGMKLAQNPKDVLNILSCDTIEGYYTTHSVYNIAKKLNVNMPVVEFMYEILYAKKDFKVLINKLIASPLSVDFI